MTNDGASKREAAFLTSAGALQRASNLLDLLTDEQIWHRMQEAGLPDDWRTELAAALRDARADYRSRWSLHARTGVAGGTPGESLPGACADATLFDAALRAVVEPISVAGRKLFGGTQSLADRFAAAAPGRGGSAS
ncbi:MAG: hypothetical protein PVI30_11600 [Myxococcales bacterium]